MAIKMLNALTAVGAGDAFRLLGEGHTPTISGEQKSLAAVKISAATVVLQGSHSNEDDVKGMVDNPSLALGTTPERFAFGTFNYRINRTNYSKTAAAVGVVFSEAHVISASKWGAINIYINAAGTWTTRVPLATQAYDTAALAHAAADLITLTSDLCYVGRILIENNAGAWTANTDDMTNASDITTATFLSATPTFRDLQTYVLDAADITAQRFKFITVNMRDKFLRLYLSALTGTGEVNAWLDSTGEGRGIIA